MSIKHNFRAYQVSSVLRTGTNQTHSNKLNKKILWSAILEYFKEKLIRSERPWIMREVLSACLAPWHEAMEIRVESIEFWN